MKFFIIFLGFAAFLASVCCNIFSEDEEQAWVDFKIDHNRLFLSPGTEQVRKNTFMTRYQGIKKHNEAFESGNVTFQKGICPYSDLTDDAFKQRFTGVSVPPQARQYTQDAWIKSSPPKAVDLRKSAGMPPIKNQNPCGSCWAFSTCVALEYQLFKIYNMTNIDLSEQYLVDCVYSGQKPYRDGCDGGWMPEAFDYLRGHLIAEEKNYVYAFTEKAGKCKTTQGGYDLFAKDKSKPTSYQVPDDDDQIRSAVDLYGVLTICVDVDDWSEYTGGILYHHDYSNVECEHAVNLVGYGEEYNQKRGKTLKYWIVRNSWDTWFGEDGYIRLTAERDAKGINKGGFLTDCIYRPSIA